MSLFAKIMRPAGGWLCLGLALALLGPVLAEDKKPAKKSEKSDKQEAKDKLVPVGALVCRIARVEGAQKLITVQIPQPVLQPSGYGFRIGQVMRDVEVRPSDDVKVRILQPPADFDEKGRPKRYTAKELKELKGTDPKLPGYTADFESLKADQIVKLYLATRKEAKGASRPKTRKKGKEEDASEADNKPEVTMVVIIAEPKK
jgi:hypothetical protein